MTSRAQALAALDLANEVRLAKANIRRTIGAMPGPAGREHAARLLEHPNSIVGSLSIGHLLTSVRGLGLTKAAVLADAIDLRSLDRRVGDLTERQRRELANLVRAGGWRSHEANCRAYAREKGLVIA